MAPMGENGREIARLPLQLAKTSALIPLRKEDEQFFPESFSAGEPPTPSTLVPLNMTSVLESEQPDLATTREQRRKEVRK